MTHCFPKVLATGPFNYEVYYIILFFVLYYIIHIIKTINITKLCKDISSTGQRKFDS